MELSLLLLVCVVFTPLALALPVARSHTRALSDVPQFILDFAPLVWLDSAETFYPTDLASFLNNVHPTLNETNLVNSPSPLSLNNLDELNSNGGDVYLASNDDFTTGPQWIRGVIPDSDAKAGDTISSAIVVHDKGQGSLDAFYFYFYGYNQGNTVLTNELGDHVGDWEHTMVRFQDGKPDAAWLSQHASGGAFKYAALEKQGDRAVVYSAKGTHANYATTGTHDHTIPGLPLEYGPLEDTTSQGTLWDPVKNSYVYTVTFPEGTAADDSSNPTFAPYEDGVPVNWLTFIGHWGDDQLPDSDPRQKDFLGFKKYVSGPTGPRDKQLNRSHICPGTNDVCVVWDVLPPGS